MIVLVTGASGGLGPVLARTLVAKGHSVYGTQRKPEHDADRGFPMLEMEINVADSVDACVARVVEREGRIDAVVNCVNQMFIGSVEEATVDEVRALYDTNVFGVIRVCQAVLPVLRRQGAGTIVNMSSLGGLIAAPQMSAYTSAKFALEAFSEALYHEMRPHGIDVVIMQPVAMAMERPATGSHLHVVPGAPSDSRSYRMLERMKHDTEASRLTPEAVAEEIHRVITRRKKPLRVPMDRAKAVTWVKRLAPQALVDRLVDNLTGG